MLSGWNLNLVIFSSNVNSSSKAYFQWLSSSSSYSDSSSFSVTYYEGFVLIFLFWSLEKMIGNVKKLSLTLSNLIK